jgi:hypothetical protein
MVSGDTLDPVSATQAFHGLSAVGGNRIPAALPRGNRMGQGGGRQMSLQGGAA